MPVALKGTVDYMSPEQAENTSGADERSDIYSLGCTLFYLLTRQSAYGGETLVQKILAHRHQPAPSLTQSRPDTPAWVESMFQQMVAKLPANRFQSMEALIEALRAHGVSEQSRVQWGDEERITPNARSDAMDATMAIQDTETAAALNSEKTNPQLPAKTSNGQTSQEMSAPTIGDKKKRATTLWLLAAVPLVCALGLAGYFAIPSLFDRTQPLNQLPADDKGLPLTELIDLVEPAVVRIDVAKQSSSSIGSGFVVDRRGWVVTNLHVVKDANAAKVVFRDKTVVKVAGLLAFNAETDLAVLQLEDDSTEFATLPLALAPPKKGEPVVAFGSPHGFSFTASEGIVSAVRNGEEIRQITLSSSGIDKTGKDGYDKSTEWIQTTAPISHGNSGGPLTNMKGRVLGLNTWVSAAGQNLNFATAATSIQKLLKQVSTTPLPWSAVASAALKKERKQTQPPVRLAVKLTATSGPTERHTIAFEGGPLLDMAISPRGDYMAISGPGRENQLVDLSTLDVTYHLNEEHANFRCVTFTHDAKRLLTGSEAGEPDDRNLLFWDRATSDMRMRMVGRETGVLSVSCSRDGQWFVSTHDLGLADLRTTDRPGDSMPLLAHDRTIPCWDATFSADSTLLLTSGEDGKMFIWRLADNPIGTSRMQAHSSAVRAGIFSPDAKYVVSAGSDGSIRWWTDWKQQDDWRMVRKLDAHNGGATCLAISDDGRHLLSGGADSVVKIWPRESDQPSHTFEGHTQAITAVAFLPGTDIVPRPAWTARHIMFRRSALRRIAE